MNKNNERSLVVGAMILVAGGMEGVAAACPPEEGGSPDPAGQRQMEIQMMDGARAQLLGAYRLNQGGQGSTLDTKVYQVGQSPLAQRYLTVGEPGVVRVMRYKQDGQDVLIEERNGSVTAKLNGQDVPPERIANKGDRVEIKDEGGKIVFSEALPEVSMKGEKGATFWSNGVALPGEKRAYMGITMDSASEDMVKHLGLAEGGEYAMIDEVYEGMPAEKAGLKSKDVIVSIDGKTPASPEAIRDALKGKKAGETVVLQVMRKGGRQEIPVTLGEWQGQNLLMKAPPLAGAVGGAGAVDWEKFADEWAKKAEEWAKSGKDMGEWQRQFHEKMQEQLQDGNMKFAVPRGEKSPMMFTVPAARERDMEEQLRVMEEQLKRMEEQMRRLERRLTTGGIAPVPPVPPVAPAPPAGGGGAPTPSFAWQM